LFAPAIGAIATSGQNANQKEEKAMNEIMKPDQTAARLLAVANEEQAVGGVEHIRFVKTDFFIGDLKVTGNEYLAHVSQLLRGYVKFGNGCVVERRLGKVADGFVMPQRNELGDLDESQWEKDASGKPRDPWSQRWILPLEHLETGDLALFESGSKGGINAIRKLCGSCGRNPRRGSPIIKLVPSSYKSKEHGRIGIPDLKIIGWEPPPETIGLPGISIK
jgi:hypothetical protein